MAPTKTLPQQFGRYRIVKPIGEGGMGTVYLAEDTFLTRKVAIKVPHFGAGDNKNMIDRFYREARVAARIDHPNICSVFDVGQIDGIHYLTMPFIEGTPMNKIARGQPWPAARAAKLVRQMALALQYLHSQGIMHRDLKPANIMIRQDGEPVLMDFGLARAFNSDSQRMTSTGAAMGTPSYMSPEQVSGEIKIHGPATDIYSLGVILYEILAGQLPFIGQLAVVYGQILHAAPEPPSRLAPGVPPALDAICLKAMGKRPEQRFLSMEEFARELENYLRTGGSSMNHPAMPAPPMLPAPNDPTEPQMIGTTKPDTTSPPRMLCPGCGQKLRLPPGSNAQRLRCPRCSTVVTAPATTTSGERRTDPGPPGRATPPFANRKPRKLLPWIVAFISFLATLGFILYLLLSGGLTPSSDDVPKNLPSEMENSLGMKFRLIPAGKFTMGSPEGEAGRAPEELPHSVEITRPFYLGTYEVTQAQYLKLMDVNPSEWKPEKRDVDYPVDSVTWEMAVAFCRKLSELPEEKQRKRVYRLPTEAEWEYACRGGDEGQRFYTGSTISGDDANFDSTSLGGTYNGRTLPVGYFKKPNRYGLHDMHGNVWEWCSDWYNKSYYQESPLRNPLGPDRGDLEMRVLRGGSWMNQPSDCRTAARYGVDPITPRNNRGFRVLLEPHASPP